MKKLTAYRLPLAVLLSAVSWLLSATPSHAVCPVCTVAVGAGVGLARFLGVDDSVSGIWIGGLILSSSFWFSSWLQKRVSLPKLLSSHLPLPISILMFLLTLIPLQISGVIGHPFNTFWNIDKLIFGTIFGSVIFLVALAADKKVRQVKGHQLFVYQKVIFPVSALIISSLVMYLLTSG